MEVKSGHAKKWTSSFSDTCPSFEEPTGFDDRAVWLSCRAGLSSFDKVTHQDSASFQELSVLSGKCGKVVAVDIDLGSVRVFDSLDRLVYSVAAEVVIERAFGHIRGLQNIR